MRRGEPTPHEFLAEAAGEEGKCRKLKAPLCNKKKFIEEVGS